MPHISISVLEQNQVQEISKPLVNHLAELVGSPGDYFTIEGFMTEFIFDGELGGNYPMMDVLWFSRSQETQDQAGKLITDTIAVLYPIKLWVFVFYLQLWNQLFILNNGEHF